MNVSKGDLAIVVESQIVEALGLTCIVGDFNCRIQCWQIFLSKIPKCLLGFDQFYCPDSQLRRISPPLMKLIPDPAEEPILEIA